MDLLILVGLGENRVAVAVFIFCVIIRADHMFSSWLCFILLYFSFITRWPSLFAWIVVRFFRSMCHTVFIWFESFEHLFKIAFSFLTILDYFSIKYMFSVCLFLANIFYFWFYWRFFQFQRILDTFRFSVWNHYFSLFSWIYFGICCFFCCDSAFAVRNWVLFRWLAVVRSATYICLF